jgi:hypothetical protein
VLRAPLHDPRVGIARAGRDCCVDCVFGEGVH